MAIKVGDKVKATLGPSTVVGIVQHVASDHKGYVRLAPEGAGISCEVVAWDNDGWTIEVIQALPTKVGAVVRNNQDGALYVRHTVNTADYYPWGEVGVSFESVWGDDTVAEGGFEILFEGVDE